MSFRRDITKDGRQIFPSGSGGGSKQIKCTKCNELFVICGSQHWNAPKQCPDCAEATIGTNSFVSELYLGIE